MDAIDDSKGTNVGATVAALSDETVRPLNDTVIVQSATIVPYTVVATLTIATGPDAAVVQDAARAAVLTYVTACHAVGHAVAVSGLYAALHQSGVVSASLTTPTADLVVSADAAPYCTAITLTVETA